MSRPIMVEPRLSIHLAMRIQQRLIQPMVTTGLGGNPVVVVVPRSDHFAGVVGHAQRGTLNVGQVELPLAVNLGPGPQLVVGPDGAIGLVFLGDVAAVPEEVLDRAIDGLANPLAVAIIEVLGVQAWPGDAFDLVVVGEG